MKPDITIINAVNVSHIQYLIDIKPFAFPGDNDIRDIRLAMYLIEGCDDTPPQGE